MSKQKNRIKPRQTYVVANPTLTLEIGEFELIVNHCMALGLSYDQSPTARAMLMEKHGQVMREMREKLKLSKEHYKIRLDK